MRDLPATVDTLTSRDAATSPFEPALGGHPSALELSGDQRVELPVDRWHAPPDAFDALVLARCTGGTLDVGCGPGRLTAALIERGVPALGVDISPLAVGLTRRRGAPALHADVFGPLPREGLWQHVLLADGNMGIGGDPAALLLRAAELLTPTGTVLVELEPPGTGLRARPARMTPADGGVGWFPWARVGVDAVATPAAEAGLTVRLASHLDNRWFAELGR